MPENQELWAIGSVRIDCHKMDSIFRKMIIRILENKSSSTQIVIHYLVCDVYNTDVRCRFQGLTLENGSIIISDTEICSKCKDVFFIQNVLNLNVN